MSGRLVSRAWWRSPAAIAEREEIALWRAPNVGVREITRRLGRSPSTVTREARRNASTRTYHLEYRASVAQWHAERRGRRPKTAKLVQNHRLREYVQDRLSGTIQIPDTSSPSQKARYVPRADSTPVLRAALKPELRCSMTRTREFLRAHASAIRATAVRRAVVVDLNVGDSLVGQRIEAGGEVELGVEYGYDHAQDRWHGASCSSSAVLPRQSAFGSARGVRRVQHR